MLYQKDLAQKIAIIARKQNYVKELCPLEWFSWNWKINGVPIKLGRIN